MVNAASDDRDSMVEAKGAIGMSFHNRDLRGYDLSNQSFQNIDFSEADLRGCKLTNADLSGANFQGAILGIDDAQVFERSIRGFFSGIAVLLFLILWIGNGFGAMGDSDEAKADEKQQSDSEGDTKLLFGGLMLWVGFIAIGLGVYVLIKRNLASSLINYVYGWMGFWSVVSVISLIVIIVSAMDLAKTDFSNAVLDGAKMNRAAFKKANAAGVGLDRINWF